MTTDELVKKLVKYINEGKNLQAEEELYAQDVVSYEQNGTMAKGLEAVMEKTKGSMANFEEFYGGGVEQTYVAGNAFLLFFHLDFKPKGGERMQMKEYGFYKVADGKIIEEHFFAVPFVH